MDLNSSPKHSSPKPFPEPINDSKNGETPSEFEEQTKRQNPNLGQNDNGQQTKRQRSNNRLPPEGWLDCPPFGRKIGSLIPSKVPLGEFFNPSIHPSKRYSYQEVLHHLKKIGLVIDLTNSYRYYNSSDWRREGVNYVKIACKGRDAVPENEDVNTFVYEVSRFLEWQKQQRMEGYVLVHCTHGHNRTGFMIVHYLKRTWPVSVAEAVQIFADARPPGIYKPDYIDALYEFYHEKKPEAAVCPPTPEWKRGDLSNGGDDDEGGDHGKGAAVVDERGELEVVLMTNDDVLGDKFPNEQEMFFRRFCYDALKLNEGGGRGGPRFPGSHPVSLNRDNLQLLRQRYYYATWKADGTRYMMLITKDGCYLIDRHFSFRRVQMRFPCRLEKGSGVQDFGCHDFTLLDGEMIIDKIPDPEKPDSWKQERRYLIYDMMAVNKVSIVDRPFYERFKMLEKEVIEPRKIERQNIQKTQNPNYRYDLEPFRVRRKDFWMLSIVTKLLKEFIPKLPHEADGLILQGWDDPYVPRTHEGLLKWKYAEMNSVDFLFEVADDQQYLYLHERGRKKLMEANQVVFPDGPDALTYSGKIIECSWDSENRVWVCMRIRMDKGTPNEFNTFKKVMRSIKDNITEDILLNEMNEIIRLPMYADRIRIESKAHRR